MMPTILFFRPDAEPDLREALTRKGYAAGKHYEIRWSSTRRFRVLDADAARAGGVWSCAVQALGVELPLIGGRER